MSCTHNLSWTGDVYTYSYVPAWDGKLSKMLVGILNSGRKWAGWDENKMEAAI